MRFAWGAFNLIADIAFHRESALLSARCLEFL
jgi:hypothetical protein